MAETEHTITIKESAIVLALFAVEKAAKHAAEAMFAVAKVEANMEGDALGEAAGQSNTAYVAARIAAKIVNTVFKVAGIDLTVEAIEAEADKAEAEYKKISRAATFELETFLEEHAGLNEDRLKQ